MEKTLELIFTKSDGAKKTLSIADPREDVTLAEAQAAAARIIEAGVLTSGGLGLNEFVEARIKELPLPCWHNDYGYQRNFQRRRQLRVPDGAELVSAAAYGAAAG